MNYAALQMKYRQWLQDMTPDEQDALHASMEVARTKLPERFKDKPMAIQDLYIMHHVELE